MLRMAGFPSISYFRDLIGKGSWKLILSFKEEDISRFCLGDPICFVNFSLSALVGCVLWALLHSDLLQRNLLLSPLKLNHLALVANQRFFACKSCRSRFSQPSPLTTPSIYRPSCSVSDMAESASQYQQIKWVCCEKIWEPPPLPPPSCPNALWDVTVLSSFCSAQALDNIFYL